MKLERSEITVLVVGLLAAFAIPFWVLDLGIWWSIGLMLLWLVIAVAVRVYKTKRAVRDAV